MSYIISELFVLLLYGILQEYGIRGENGSIIIANTSKKAEEYLAGTIHPGAVMIKLFSAKRILSTY